MRTFLIPNLVTTSFRIRRFSLPPPLNLLRSAPTLGPAAGRTLRLGTGRGGGRSVKRSRRKRWRRRNTFQSSSHRPHGPLREAGVGRGGVGWSGGPGNPSRKEGGDSPPPTQPLSFPYEKKIQGRPPPPLLLEFERLAIQARPSPDNGPGQPRMPGGSDQPRGSRSCRQFHRFQRCSGRYMEVRSVLDFFTLPH